MMKQNKQVKTKGKKIDSKFTKDDKAVGVVSKNIGGKAPLGSKKAPVVKKASNELKISQVDKLRIFLACIFLGLGVFGYYYFRVPNPIFFNANPLVSYLCPIIGILAFLFIILYWCSFGKDIINYIKEATTELKKVVWPDRKTATRMTMLVIFFVFILALVMWISDTFIRWILYDIILRR